MRVTRLRARVKMGMARDGMCDDLEFEKTRDTMARFSGKIR